MALFQKKIVPDSRPLYTLGLQQTKLVVGLGNPGKQYQTTRHNAGFMAVDELVKQQSFDDWHEKKDMKCLFSSGQLGSSRVICIKPTTFMNLSGEAAQAVMSFYKINPEDVLVIYDDKDIPFGTIRTRSEGSSGGHNGIKSLLGHIGDSFGRIKIGIANEHLAKKDTADHVLEKFSGEEQQQLPVIIKEAAIIATEAIASDTLPTETRTLL